ncbi:F/Y-rich N-terminus-domain-containing protein [Cokeromyces recurvatus]|uniref:F/Y-rich N-terminus-domain-containing protein n=1 Tax=Cokeromyces recurvatus TaxID=90255 RepID=UPI002220A602|nr:F/Y-rich N-terminus-domain-containing protein [Cokeromyces recurvatus]KAI7898377.1 F/Y-rich N-terminus-domain-containing protein [Cokeromyces recurvatus]
MTNPLSTIHRQSIPTSPTITENTTILHIKEDISTITEDSPSSTVTEESLKQLKRKMKEITELNIAMHRDYFHAKKKIRTLTFERNLLLDSINRLENMEKSNEDSDSELYSELSDTEDEVDALSTFNNHILKPKVIIRKATNKAYRSSPSTILPHISHEITTPSTPPKRSKMGRVSLKTRRVQPIERDADGKPKLPQQIGVLTVLNLGKIITDRPAFHNERYIFPVGYTVSRTYPSMIDPDSNTTITSTILDGGDGPRFHVVAADMPDEPIIANSATGAWTVVVRRSNEIRHRDHSNSASGPDYYGFKHPTIANLIQDLPGAKELKQYVWQSFEEMEPRAAKGVMAAAEKKRGNLEQMGNANRKVPKIDNQNTIVFVNEEEHHADEEDGTDELGISDKEEI